MQQLEQRHKEKYKTPLSEIASRETVQNSPFEEASVTKSRDAANQDQLQRKSGTNKSGKNTERTSASIDRKKKINFDEVDSSKHE